MMGIAGQEDARKVTNFMDSPILKLFSLFSKREQRRLILIAIAVLGVSVLGIVEIGSLGPFIAVAANPGIVSEQPVLAFLYHLGGFDNQDNGAVGFLIFLGIVIFALIIVVTAFKTGVSYIVFRFTANRRYTLGVKLFRQYVFQPYQFFLNQNTGELSKNLLSEVDMVINGVLRPALGIFTHGMMALAIFVFLIVLNPTVAVLAVGIFGGLYWGLYAVIRPRLSLYGKDARVSNRLRYKTAMEAFGGIKDIKILGKEPFFVAAYNRGAKRFAASQAANQILTTLPGQVIQSLAMGFAIALLVMLLMVNGSLTEILPLLTIYAFAVVRLVPNIQHVFQGMAHIRYSAHAVDSLYQDMTTLRLPPKAVKNGSGANVKVLPFARNITLSDIQFSYPASREPVLKGIDFTITKNTAIAFAGTTGCGKTTLVDVIMGLLDPSAGEIKVDDIPVIVPLGSVPLGGVPLRGSDNRADIALWQRNFGYVPQQIYLSDDTVAANIAFGIPEKLRNAEAVEHAAKTANLHDFIMGELPQGYNTMVGERGIRLSGGQRQRVGIARALYHDPNILVMDEATSALDSVTEDAVMDAIHNLMHTKTIIIIAHRLSTIQECDMIYLMDRGKIAAKGTYAELLRDNQQFRALAKATEHQDDVNVL